MSKSWKFLFAMVVVLVFGYFIWPSPYAYYDFRGSTIRIDRLNGCEHIRTPTGFVTIGNDAMCFLPSESGRSPGSYLITADPELYSEDYARDIADEAIKSIAPDMMASSQMKVISNLVVSFKLTSPGPVIEVINKSACEIWSIDLKIPRENQNDYSEYKFETGNLKPGEKVFDYVIIDKKSAKIGIKISAVSFYDQNATNPLNSPCVNLSKTIYDFNPFKTK
jgi:hypothetical protein